MAVRMLRRTCSTACDSQPPTLPHALRSRVQPRHNKRGLLRRRHMLWQRRNQTVLPRW